MRVSFEFFPPSDATAEASLWRSLFALERLAPAFVSVTYRAFPESRWRTHAVVERIQDLTQSTAVPHLTCVGETPDSVRQILRRYWASGVRHIVALRGDECEGLSLHPELRYANDLVGLIRQTADFEVSVAAYPEVHPQAPSPEFDIDNLKRKLDRGASRAITQFFFDNTTFLRFRDRCARAGFYPDLAVGILPMTRLAKLRGFARQCGASLPPNVLETFAGLENDPETFRLLAVNFAIDQVRDLVRHGVEDFHFYTLNRYQMTYAICHAIGIRSKRLAYASA